MPNIINAGAPQAIPALSNSQPVNQLIHGINTAGTVRVNNLANLEAMVNLVVTGLEIVFLALAVYFLVHFGCSVSSGRTWKRQLILGLACGCFALILPNVINFLIASFRDASLMCGGW